jgi:hypothetical protein
MEIKMIKKDELYQYVMVGSYQTTDGSTKDVMVYGKSLYHCVKRVKEKDMKFGIDQFNTSLRGGYLVADYDVSRQAETIARYIT